MYITFNGEIGSDVCVLCGNNVLVNEYDVAMRFITIHNM